MTGKGQFFLDPVHLNLYIPPEDEFSADFHPQTNHPAHLPEGQFRRESGFGRGREPQTVKPGFFENINFRMQTAP
jgi:hypothetical protein